MYALDMAAAFALAAGAFLGARKGLWRLTAAVLAVALGGLVGCMASGRLGAAFSNAGVAYPGDALLGFFLPFALSSVYTRYVIGTWLADRMETDRERNRILGAAAGVAWAMFAAGFFCRVGGLGEDGGRDRAPFCHWLARYPGAVRALVQADRLIGRKGERTWESALKAALDGERVQARAARADAEAASEIARRQPLRLRLDSDASGQIDAQPRLPR